MSNTITINGSFTTKSDNRQFKNTLTTLINTTGSAMISEVQTIPTGAVTTITMSPLTNVRYVALTNEGDGNITFYDNDFGDISMFTMLPNDVAILPNSGSMALYAQAFVSGSNLSIIAGEI